MNILVVAKLANHTLSENVLSPLLSSKYVDNIYVLRDERGDDMGKRVKYLTLNNKSKSMFRHIQKMINGIYFCGKYNIKAIIGVLIYPHGYIGRTISRITGIPYVHMTIAGHREFWLEGPRIEKRNISMFGSAFHIMVTGSQTKNYLLNKGINSEKISILPNLPNEVFSHIDCVKMSNRKYDIVSFSRIDKNKNVTLLIRALAQLKGKFNLKVAIAGDGEELDNVRKYAVEFGVDSNISFMGFISGIEDKVKLLTDSKIFISCSKGEGFPVSLLEAMSCGCVPVVSNVGDIVDVIEQGVNGFVFNDTDDEAEFVGYLSELICDNAMMDKMSTEAQNIKSKISVKNNGEIWDGVLSKIDELK